MKNLEKNITNLFGDRAKRWLDALPELINTLVANWQLTNIQPVDNMSWNYVAKANSKEHGAVILKISCDEEIICDEVKALEHFSGHGMVELIEHDTKYHAMLLHQAIPGKSLRSIYPDKIKETTKNYLDVVKKIISVPQQDHSNFKHISYWLKAFDRADQQNDSMPCSCHSRVGGNPEKIDWQCCDENKLPVGLLQRAIDLKNKLLETSGKEFVLHGDLHHDNILSDGDGWIAIDPKGIVGEVEFEAACFDFIHKSELDNPDVPKLFEERSKLLADALNLNHQRFKDWVFVRLVLGACWMAEGGGDEGVFLGQCKAIFD